MFDSRKQYKISINSGGLKSCVVRFPDDAEWEERARKQTAVRHELGRGESELKVTSGGGDIELLKKIRIDTDGPEFTDAEASIVLGKLEQSTVTETADVPDGVKVSMIVLGKKDVALTLKSPTADQVLKYSRVAMRAVDGKRFQKLQFRLGPGGELFDALVTSKEGYAAAVPLPHKCAALSEVIGREATEIEEVEDPNSASPAASEV